METLEIESQTDQTPLACRSSCPSQGKLAKAENLFDDPDHWFDGAFACLVDRFAQSSSELVGHLDLYTGILRLRGWQGRKTLLPAGMIGITARRDVWMYGSIPRLAQAASVAGPK
jgi:hypothetical protein